MKEGWGLTHRVYEDDIQIFLSDGSNKIYWAYQNFTIFKVSDVIVLILMNT